MVVGGTVTALLMVPRKPLFSLVAAHTHKRARTHGTYLYMLHSVARASSGAKYSPYVVTNNIPHLIIAP